MNKDSLEKKYNVDIEENFSAYKCKKIGWTAYKKNSLAEICKGKTLKELEYNLKLNFYI